MHVFIAYAETAPCVFEIIYVHVYKSMFNTNSLKKNDVFVQISFQ